MPTKTFDFDLSELNLTVTADEIPGEIGLSVDVDYDVYPAEPDVGIFGSDTDITEWTFSLNGESFTRQFDFSTALHQLIGEYISEDADEINQNVTAFVDTLDVDDD